MVVIIKVAALRVERSRRNPSSYRTARAISVRVMRHHR
jgi:hypothetical protein